jgi:hypothetical protein
MRPTVTVEVAAVAAASWTSTPVPAGENALTGQAALSSGHIWFAGYYPSNAVTADAGRAAGIGAPGAGAVRQALARRCACDATPSNAAASAIGITVPLLTGRPVDFSPFSLTSRRSAACILVGDGQSPKRAGRYHRPFGAALSTAASRFAVATSRVALHALICSGATRA